MKQRGLKVVGIIGLALIAGAVGSARADRSAIETVTLKNGLRVVLAPDPQAKAVDVAMWYATGSRFEKPGRSGITHLFERLMLNGAGTADARDLGVQLQAEGATVNTFTSPDFTSIFATVPADAVERALDFQAARMVSLRPTAARLEDEREFVLRERRVVLETNPILPGIEKLFATAFPGSGYGRPVIGLEGDVSKTTLDDVLAYQRDRYAPGNAVLTLVGAFDPHAVLAAVRAKFESIPRRSVATKAEPLPAPIPRVAGRMAGRVPMLVAGWRAPVSADASTAALELLARVLWAGSRGRLSSVPPVAQAIANFDARKDGSLFYVVALARSSADSAVAEARVLDAVQKLAEEPIGADELDRAKRYYELAFVNDQQTVRGRARTLGTSLLTDGDVTAEDKRLDSIRNLTPTDLQLVAQRVLKPEARSVVWLMPDAASPDGSSGGAR